MRVVYILKFIGFCLLQAESSRKNDLNNSKDKVEPSVFWLIQSSRHNLIGPQTSVAYLHSVDIKTPDPSNAIPTSLEALLFSNARDSYVEVPEDANSFSPNSAMAILFYLYFEEAYQNATLIQFKGTSGGFELFLRNGVLSAIFFSKTGTKYEHSSPGFDLKPYRWHFVGAEYNKLWADNDQFDLLHIDMSSSSQPRYFSTLTVSGNIPDIDMDGCMRLGQNFAEDSSFSGYMSCLQFYTVSVFHPNEILKDLYEKCDPNLWIHDWDSTADFISGSSPFCISEFTTTLQFVTSDTTPTETNSTTQQHLTTVTTKDTTETSSTTIQQPVTTAKDTTETDKTATRQPVTSAKDTTETDKTTTQQPVTSAKDTTETDKTTTQQPVTSAKDTTETDKTTTQQPVTSAKDTTETDKTTTQQPVTTVKDTTEINSTTIQQPVTTAKVTTETDSSTKQPITTAFNSTEKGSTTLQPVTTVQNTTETDSTTTQPLTTARDATETTTIQQPVTTAKDTAKTKSTIAQPVTLPSNSRGTDSTTDKSVTTTLHSHTSSLFTIASNPSLSLSTESQPLTSSSSSNWSFVTPSLTHITYEIIEGCVRFEKQENNQAAMADLGVYTYGTISECVYRCIRNSLCDAVSYINVSNVIVCSATSDFSSTVFAIGHTTYFRKN